MQDVGHKLGLQPAAGRDHLVSHRPPSCPPRGIGLLRSVSGLQLAVGVVGGDQLTLGVEEQFALQPEDPVHDLTTALDHGNGAAAAANLPREIVLNEMSRLAPRSELAAETLPRILELLTVDHDLVPHPFGDYRPACRRYSAQGRSTLTNLGGYRPTCPRSRVCGDGPGMGYVSVPPH